jgi:hypothetical protein
MNKFRGYTVQVLASSEDMTRSIKPMFTFILALLLAAIALAVLAYLSRRATLGIAAAFALGLAVHFALAQFGMLVSTAWSSWFGA